MWDFFKEGYRHPSLFAQVHSRECLSLRAACSLTQSKALFLQSLSFPAQVPQPNYMVGVSFKLFYLSRQGTGSLFVQIIRGFWKMLF